MPLPTFPTGVSLIREPQFQFDPTQWQLAENSFSVMWVGTKLFDPDKMRDVLKFKQWEKQWESCVLALTTARALQGLAFCKSIQVWQLQNGSAMVVLVVNANQKVKFCRCVWPSACFELSCYVQIARFGAKICRPTFDLHSCMWACLTKQQWAIEGNVEAKRSCSEQHDGSLQSEHDGCREAGWTWGCCCIQGKIWGPTATGRKLQQALPGWLPWLP